MRLPRSSFSYVILNFTLTLYFTIQKPLAVFYCLATHVGLLFSRLCQTQAGAHHSVYGRYHKSSGMHVIAASAQFIFKQIKPQAAGFVLFCFFKEESQIKPIKVLVIRGKII